MEFLQKSQWIFDQAVAERFQTEAEQHIPDYHKVISLCLTYTRSAFENSAIRIIDVGSALGYTVDTFVNAGFSNTFGVEKSQDMIDRSLHKGNIFHASIFPAKKWDVVLANWTLHFIRDRKGYLEDIFNSMSDDGMLILSDKMDSSDFIQHLYHNFKRSNGVSDDIIKAKAESLKGVLTTLPLSWYLQTLQDLGFKDIQVINAAYMFNTIYCRK
jgi:trans-aconitate methyltransferase